MFNKNDPLVGAVQEVMKRNQAERDAAKLVNEKFGIHDRKALPHERQGEWDTAYKAVLTEGIVVEPRPTPKTQPETKVTGGQGIQGYDKSARSAGSARPQGDNPKVSMNEKLVGNQPNIDVASSTGKKKPDGKLTKHDFEHLRAMKEEEQIDEAGMMPQGKIAKKILAMKAGMKARQAEKRAWDDRGMMGPGPDFEKDRNKMLRMRKVQARLQKEDTLDERKMTSTEKTKEEKLKTKLDPSGMKASMKKQYGKEKGEKIYFATIRKKAMKEDNEGFNNRHGLSVTASAEKQVVAEVTMGGSAPAIAQRRIGASQRFRPRGAPTSTIQTSSKGPISQKPGINTATGSLDPTTNQRRSGYNITNVRDTAYGTNPTAKRLGPASSTGGSQSPIPISKTTSRFDDSGVRRPISGTNNLQTRLANMRKNAPALDATRDKNLDQPATQSNMSRVMQAQDAAKRANMAGGGVNVPKPTLDAKAQGAKVGTSTLAKPSGATAQPYGMNIPKKLNPDSRIAKGNVTPSVLPQTMQRGAEQDKVGVKRVEPVKSAPSPAAAPAPVRATPVAPVAKKETEFTRMMRRSQSKNDVAGTPGKRY